MVMGSALARHRTPILSSSFLSPAPVFGLKLSLPPRTNTLTARPRRRFPAIVAAQTNWLRVIQTAWRIGKDGIEAGTNFLPEMVPRPIARIGVTVIAMAIVLFVLQSVLSTAFFVLAMMGVIYFSFMALNTSEASGGVGRSTSTSTDEDTLEEARRIMEKYK